MRNHDEIDFMIFDPSKTCMQNSEHVKLALEILITFLVEWKWNGEKIPFHSRIYFDGNHSNRLWRNALKDECRLFVLWMKPTTLNNKKEESKIFGVCFSNTRRKSQADNFFSSSHWAKGAYIRDTVHRRHASVQRMAAIWCAYPKPVQGNETHQFNGRRCCNRPTRIRNRSGNSWDNKMCIVHVCAYYRCDGK